MTKKFKKIISVVCVFAWAVCSIGNVCFAKQKSDKFTYTVESKFNDVKTSDWFFEAVSKCEDLGIVSGYGNGKFGPNDPVTMEQVCLMSLRCLVAWYPADSRGIVIYHGMGEDEGLNLDNAVLTAKFDELVPGAVSGEENPRMKYGTDFKKPAYREEALSCLYRTYKKGEYKEWIDKMNIMRGTENKYVDNPNIPDYQDISDVFKNDISEAYKIGIAQGYDETGAFKPQNEITRAEFCQMLFNSGIVEAIHGHKNGLL